MLYVFEQPFFSFKISRKYILQHEKSGVKRVLLMYKTLHFTFNARQKLAS